MGSVHTGPVPQPGVAQLKSIAEPLHVPAQSSVPLQPPPPEPVQVPLEQAHRLSLILPSGQQIPGAKVLQASLQ